MSCRSATLSSFSFSAADKRLSNANIQSLYPTLAQRQSTATLKFIHDKSMTMTHSASPLEATNPTNGCHGCKHSCEVFQLLQNFLEQGKELEQKLEEETVTEQFGEALLAHVHNLQNLHEAAKSCHSWVLFCCFYNMNIHSIKVLNCKKEILIF